MDQRIVGFHQDEEQHWVAELECGHNQHVRHNPPWINRPWAVTADGRSNALGKKLACSTCDASIPHPIPQETPMTNTVTSKLCGAATVFVVRDVLRSVEHFRDALGFKTGFTYGEPTFYAGVERDDVIIHLQAAHESKRQPGQGAVNVFVTDVDALYLELKSRGAKTLNEPKDYPYGMRDFDVEDLDGNHLCFGMESKQQPAGR